jgi:hypothetical protein
MRPRKAANVAGPTLQIPREKDDINLIRSKRRADGRVQRVLRGVGGRGKMMRRNAAALARDSAPAPPLLLMTTTT